MRYILIPSSCDARDQSPYSHNYSRLLNKCYDAIRNNAVSFENHIADILEKLDAMGEIYLKTKISDVKQQQFMEVQLVAVSKYLVQLLLEANVFTPISKEDTVRIKKTLKKKNHKEKCHYEGKTYTGPAIRIYKQNNIIY